MNSNGELVTEPGANGQARDVSHLSELLTALQSVRDGDFSVRLPGDRTGLEGKIADTLNEIVATNARMARELERVGKAVGRQGKTRQRVKFVRSSGAWGEMEDSVNTLIDDLLWPLTERTRVISAVAQGDLMQSVPLEVDGRPLQGEFLRSARIVNTMIEQLRVFTSEVTRVAREVGVEGRLGGQANVPGTAGTWKDLTGNVNLLAANLTNQVHAIAEVATETDRRKDEFLAMLSHELRNPLAPIRNAVSILSLLGSSDPHLAQARDVVDRQVAHLTRLVDDLLDASRLTRGQITLKCEPLPLSDVIDGALESSRPIIEQHEHSLSVQLPDDPILVHGDRTRLIQVVTNLLTNAAKFTPKGGYVSVSVEQAGTGATIRVRDTGIGIPKAAQSRIFELFAQEETTLARSQGGLGIGLTLVKQIIELHGGRVELESDGKGKGTEVRVLLPALTLPVRLDRDSNGHEALQQPAQLRVLVVDDNVDSAESFKMLLELSGHHVETAHDGLAALRLVDEFDPHVAFVDLGLPGLDGFEVGRRILQHRHKPPVLIALSGYGREEDKQRTKAVGFHHHLVKPVDYSTVLAYLSTLGAATIAQERSMLVH